MWQGMERYDLQKKPAVSHFRSLLFYSFSTKKLRLPLRYDVRLSCMYLKYTSYPKENFAFPLKTTVERCLGK
jgi:hypothetical protein